MKKFKKLKNKIQGLSFKLDKTTTKLSDLDELDSVIENFKKQTDSKYKVDVDINILEGSVEVKRVRKPYLKLVK
jgi:hypothetical protein